MKYLIQALTDLDEQFKQHGGPGLLLFRGNPVEIFRRLNDEIGINKLCYEQDCEPIFNKRDRDVEEMCRTMGIEVVERVSHTLWDPLHVIR